VPDIFLEDHEPITWRDDPVGSLTPRQVFTGEGNYAVEIAFADAPGQPSVADLRDLWRKRHGHRANPVVLVVVYPTPDGTERAAVCGPHGDSPPVEVGLEVGQVERLCAVALAEPNRNAAAALLQNHLKDVATALPGIRNEGMLATHELERGVPGRADWDAACARGRGLLDRRGKSLVEGLGFAVESLTGATQVLTTQGQKTAVAIFLDETETFEDGSLRLDGVSPVSKALSIADHERLPWVVLTRGTQIRLYATSADTGVGRRGREETFVELNLALVREEQAGYLPLLFAEDALADDGTFAEILATSRRYAVELGARLRSRVYEHAVPPLATAVARKAEELDTDEPVLDVAYEMTMLVLFRLLFVAYAEDNQLLPYDSNSQYRAHSLKAIAADLTEQVNAGTLSFDAAAVDRWHAVTDLWEAVNGGHTEWGVPKYNGGLFSDHPTDYPAGHLLSLVELTNEEFGPALVALLVDDTDTGDGVGPVDFRSLSAREFGTIYEGLLESELSRAPSDLTLDAKAAYVPARPGDDIEVPEGHIYFHDRSGARKSTGSYFTKPFAVEHLLDHALEPALADHLESIAAFLDDGDEAAAADAFFDFRCVDLAMGSGHFLVAAVDRIEARLSAFLAERPIPLVKAELDTLEAGARTQLGELAAGIEIETGKLLRRQVARKCIYGVDVNQVAVDLARLAIWIHTFVPGLPLSFLDHNLVHGNSLTGIGTIDEAMDALDTSEESLFGGHVRGFLDRASAALRRLGTIVEVTTEDIARSRAAHHEALEAVEPARQLFDMIVAARLGEATIPETADEDRVARAYEASTAGEVSEELGAVHFPIAFPEVFLRENPGFDCILGNPPWEEATLEKLGFWAARFPGLKSMGQRDQGPELARLEAERPDLVHEYEVRLAEADHVRASLLAGPYPGMGTGDPDLYKAFVWRFWNLCRWNGAIGVVLPRSALAAKGCEEWRRAVLEDGNFTDVTLLLNNKRWVFDEVHPQYTVALVTVRANDPNGTLTFRGPFASLQRYAEGVVTPPTTFPVDDFLTWSDTAAFPLLPSEQSAAVYGNIRTCPVLGCSNGWQAIPATEFHATNDKVAKGGPVDVDSPGRPGEWPVLKGASFNIWEPDTGIVYGYADPDETLALLDERRNRSRRRANSPFSGFPPGWITDTSTLPCLHPRIAFRDITNRTNQRTVIAALLPPQVFLTNKAPYLLWPEGDERDETYLLGVLCSIPLDWCARRVVEINLNFHIFNSLPVPRPDRDDPLRREVEQIAGRLAAVDERYSDWAETVGVPVGSISDDGEKADLIARLDAAVALLYGLDREDVIHIFETFHEGWDPTERLDEVLRHFDTLA